MERQFPHQYNGRMFDITECTNVFGEREYIVHLGSVHTCITETQTDSGREWEIAGQFLGPFYSTYKSALEAACYSLIEAGWKGKKHA